PALSAVIKQLTEAGVTIFASSGNGGSVTKMGAPACNTGVIAVGATYDSDLGRQPSSGTYQTLFNVNWPDCYDATSSTKHIACFTSTAGDRLDLLAPGAQIQSVGLGSGTSTYRGTSQASPAAAGV